MTDGMRQEQLDREIRGFLAWQAEDLSDPPTVTDIARQIGSHGRTRSTGPRLAPQLVLVLLVGLLIAGLVGAVAVGARLLLDDGRPPFSDAILPSASPAAESSPTSDPSATFEAPTPTVAPQDPPAVVEDPLSAAYEAVFLRLEVVDGSPEVLVISVDAAGRERQLARLPEAWVAYKIRNTGTFLAPMGAVSATGLLAIPVSGGGEGPLPVMHWEIFDLHRPQAEPILVPGIEQGLEQLSATPYLTADDMRPGVTWAAGERLGIAAHSCDAISCGAWSFFDGRTGVAIVGRPHAEPMCQKRDRSGAEIIVVDGGLVRRASDGSREELVSPSGIEFACLAPDDSMIMHTSQLSPSFPVAGLIDLDGGTRSVVEGNFAGWLGVDP